VRKLVSSFGNIFVMAAVAKNLSFLFAGMIAAIFSSAAAGEITGGKAIFDRTCSNCHYSPKVIRTPAAELETRLQSGTIRPHRFKLSGDELAQVISYLQSVQP
jgi:cytochrome c5